MMKYKVVSRIVADKDCFEKRKDGDFNEKQSYLQELIDKYGFICYKIIAGMYIFYENRYWLITGYPSYNGIYEKAVMQLCQYKLRWQNAKGEIMLMMDSRIGGPENPRFIYDGSDVALLYRSQESSVAFRDIEQGARLPLKSVTEILVVEIENDDVEREYIVPVRLIKDVSKLINS